MQNSGMPSLGKTKGSIAKVNERQKRERKKEVGQIYASEMGGSA